MTYIHKANVDFIDQFIADEDEQGHWGIPFGSWIQLTGVPGSGKTTVGVQLLQGLCSSSLVEGHHLDYEMRSTGARRLYKSIGITHPSFAYQCEPDPATILDRMYTRADELLNENKSLAVLVDSFTALVPNLKLAKQIELATYIKDRWETHPNLLLITVNHVNKRGQVGGAAQIQQLCDVVVSVERENHFTYLTPKKNRLQAPGAPESIKLYRDNTGYHISQEPDFISSNPIVSFVREQLKKKERPKI